MFLSFPEMRVSPTGEMLLWTIVWRVRILGRSYVSIRQRAKRGFLPTQVLSFGREVKHPKAKYSACYPAQHGVEVFLDKLCLKQEVLHGIYLQEMECISF